LGSVTVPLTSPVAVCAYEVTPAIKAKSKTTVARCRDFIGCALLSGRGVLEKAHLSIWGLLQYGLLNVLRAPHIWHAQTTKS
jgi:hypothetical protein